jgi:hypothetical protein
MRYITDPQVIAIRDAVSLEPDEQCAREAATVTVRLRGGETVTDEIAACRGSAARPLSQDELHTKVRGLVEPVLPGTSAQLIDAVEALWDARSLDRLAALVRGSR